MYNRIKRISEDFALSLTYNYFQLAQNFSLNLITPYIQAFMLNLSMIKQMENNLQY